MPHARPLLVVGPGAVGGTLAARWSQAGLETLLLGRDARSERALARGFGYRGPDGRLRRARRGLVSARSRRGPALAAFFCVKAGDLPASLRAARPWIGPETAVVGLQNGVGHEAPLRRAFGPARVVLGSCLFAADRPEPGLVSHSWGDRVVLASGARNARAAGLAAELLRKGGWAVGLASDEARMLWTKLCFNAATNPLGALCAETNGRLAEEPALKELVLAALSEAVRAASASGRRPLETDMASLVLRSCRAAPLQRNSMLQDLAAGRRTERRAILGPLLAAARRSRVPVPLLARLDRLVGRLEAGLGRRP